MMPGMTALVVWGRSLRFRKPQLGGLERSRLRAKTKARRSAFEALEGRITPTTFFVVNALDGPGAGPSGSLRNAINLANQSGDGNGVVVITPKVRASIALNSGELTIDASLSVLNRSGGPIELRQQTPGQRVFEVSSNALAARVNVGATSRRETLTIVGGNVSTGNGGGILVENPANVLTLTHVNLVGNSAGLASMSNTGQNGGGVYSSGRVVLVQSTVGTAEFPNQTSGNGGGVWAGAGLMMTASTVSGNQAGTNGGGGYVNSGDATMASGSSLSGNTALNGTAGGVYVASGNTTVSRSRVDDNRALNVGGVNEVKGDVRVLNGSEVNRNSSTAPLDVSSGNFGGGGIYEGIGNVFVSRSQVNDNHSVGMYSSGIVVGLGGVTVTARSQINGNSANGPGGGIAANFGGIVTVSGGSQVNHNSGSGNGGGIVNFAGPMGGVRVLGRSEVSRNVVTNYESLGEAVGVFLEVLAGTLGLDPANPSGGASPAAVTAEITQIEQEVASTASRGGSQGDPSGFVVSGGGVGTLLGAFITVSGGHVDDNLVGVRVPSGNAHSVGIGGGLFSGLGPITLQGGAVNGNTSMGAGGGVWNQGSMSSIGSTIADNNAVASPGGGLYNATAGTASIVRGTVRANRASHGGGVYNRGMLGLVGGAVTRNSATVQGGGILNRGRMTVVRTTVVANSPDNISPPT
jgi:hypothetical protein